MKAWSRPTVSVGLAVALGLTTLPAAAVAQDWGRARTLEVQLSSFAYEPSTIRLAAGEPVVLRLVNSGRGGHNFAAPDFFAAATLRPGGAVAGGAVEVPGRSVREVALVPARGRYRLRCTHTLHTAFGMRGEIVVE